MKTSPSSPVATPRRAGHTGTRGLASTLATMALAAAAALATACASLPAAEMLLPAHLAGQASEPVSGIGAGRRGEFRIGDASGRFERGADRLSLFGVVDLDRVGARYTLQRAGGGATIDASCKARQTTVNVGVITGQPRPWSVRCEWQDAARPGVAAQLDLEGREAAAGTRSERHGRFVAGSVTLELRSVHRVQGSPLPLAHPIGYVLVHEGREVGAIELNGTTPRLWRPSLGSALAEPVTLAALALALLWDPGA